MTDQKVIDYTIVEAHNTEALAQEVRSLIEDGWIPHGTAFTYKIQPTATAIYFAQPLVKYGRPHVDRPGREVLTNGRHGST